MAHEKAKQLIWLFILALFLSAFSAVNEYQHRPHAQSITCQCATTQHICYQPLNAELKIILSANEQLLQ